MSITNCVQIKRQGVVSLIIFNKASVLQRQMPEKGKEKNKPMKENYIYPAIFSKGEEEKQKFVLLIFQIYLHIVKQMI